MSLGGADVAPTKQSVSSEPDDPILGFMAFQNQLHVYQHGQGPAQLAQPAAACPGHCHVLLNAAPPTHTHTLTSIEYTACAVGHVIWPQGVRDVLSAWAAHPLLSHPAHPSGHTSPKHTHTLL